MRTITIILCSILFAGCSAINSRTYAGDNSKPNTVGVLYTTAITRVDGDPRQAGADVIKLEDKHANIIKLDSRVDLKPGTYTLYAKWWHLVEDNSYWIIGAGALLHPVIDGKVIRSPEQYKITFNVKSGMTYVIDVESTMKFLKKYPNKLCIKEEKHNALGAEGPRLNLSIRYPSNNAKIISCGKI